MSDPFISLTCPYCGSKMQKDLKRNLLVCPACGSEHLIKENVGSLTPPARENVNTCPRCMRNDQVMKVSAILSSQVHQTEGTTQVSDVSSDYKGRVYSTTRTVPTHATQMSELARKLSMPDLPTNPYVSGCLSYLRFIVYLVAAFFIFAAIVFLTTPYEFNYTGQFIVEIGGPALVFTALSIYLHKRQVSIRKKKNDFENELRNMIIPKWERAQKRWNNAYYCSRDDLVFINDENASVDADQFSTWLIQTAP